jgi:hypothetical protein
MAKKNARINNDWYANFESFYYLDSKEFFIQKQNFERFKLKNGIHYRFFPNALIGEKYLTCIYLNDRQIGNVIFSVFKIICYSNE